MIRVVWRSVAARWARLLLTSLAIVAIYPFMKRITSWPQVVLGFAFAYGGLMGWAAWYGSLSWADYADVIAESLIAAARALPAR